MFVHAHGTTTYQCANACAPNKNPISCTYIGRFELVDDGSFAAVVQSQTQHIDLFLPQAEPASQFIQQPH